MTSRKTLTLSVLALGLTFIFGASAFAQQGQPRTGGDSQQQGERGEGRRGGPRGEGRGFGMGGGLQELNLTDAQKEQARAIFDRFRTSIRPQREQLEQLREQRKAGNAPADADERARALRTQIHDAEKAMHAELLNILTPEQRTRFEQMQKERKERRDEMRQRREGGQSQTEQ